MMENSKMGTTSEDFAETRDSKEEFSDLITFESSKLVNSDPLGDALLSDPNQCRMCGYVKKTRETVVEIFLNNKFLSAEILLWCLACYIAYMAFVKNAWTKNLSVRVVMLELLILPLYVQLVITILR